MNPDGRPAGSDADAIPAREGPRRNRLLAALPREAYLRLEPSLTEVDLPTRHVLHPQEGRIDTAWFPITGLVSMREVKAGHTVELATIGREGVVGVPAILSAGRMPAETIQQVPGRAARVPVGELRAASDEHPALHRVLDRYTAALVAQMATVAACNRVHEVEQRGARWLLMAQDRLEQPAFTLTHDFLLAMFGAPLVKIYVMLAAFQRAGVLAYDSEYIRILDRSGLEARACDCYATMTRELEEVFGPG